MSVYEAQPGGTRVPVTSQQSAVLRALREAEEDGRGGLSDLQVHRLAWGWQGSGPRAGEHVIGPSLPESTVKHLLNLEKKCLVRREGSARDWSRRWFTVGPKS